MQKSEITLQFAYRLKEAMIAAGFNSVRSPSGVNLAVLQTITGYSVQICRKYIRGDALPDISKTIAIAAHLNVSPAWLLFGETNVCKQPASQYIAIQPALLYHIFKTLLKEICTFQEIDDMADLLLSLTGDIATIHAPNADLKKIIELTLSSAFTYKKRKGTRQ